MDRNTLEKTVALRRELHARPELSGRETRTKERLQEFLRTNTSLELVDHGPWFHALKRGRGEKPPIAFRADMDAVAMDETIPLPYASQTPGVSHKCGHDGHSAVLAALALETDNTEPCRDVYCIFQHAEETGQGARECVSLIREKGIGEVYAFHNMSGLARGCVGIRNGTMNCASQGLCINLTGLRAHASLPETGKNPAFAVADLVLSIPGLIRQGTFSGPVWCTVIRVAVGSENFGIAAGDGSVLLTCRGERECDMLALTEAVVDAARVLARRDGLEMETSLHDVFPETVNHSESTDRVRAVAAKLGYPLYEMPEPMRSSEDVGHFFKAAKGAFFLIHTGDRPAIHTPEYDFDDRIIEQAVEMFKALV